jgi:hypothetical protein
LRYRFFLILTLFLVKKIIEHSQSQDKFLSVYIKRLSEAQNFDNELKWVSAMNDTLLARNQKLETQLAEESREKAGKHLHNLFNYSHARV